MASTKSLTSGMSVTINSGPHAGRTAIVFSPTVVPDGLPNQRKVLVKITEADGSSWDEYILPKQLDIPGLVRVPKSKFSLTHIKRDRAEVTPIESLDDPSLDEYRSNRPGIVKKYVKRSLPGGKSDIDVMLSYWEERDDEGYSTNVGLVGDTQSGKTMLVEVLSYKVAKAMGLSKPLPIFTLSGSSAITDHDLFGQYRPDDDGNLVWMEGIVAKACRVGGILYLDEVNAIPGNVTSALHPITDERRQFVNLRKPLPDGHGGFQPEVVNVNKNLWVLCTYNPGYSGMNKTNEAFAARFEWLPWDYDEEVEKALIKSPAVRLLGQALRLARETRALTTPVGTSALQRLERNLARLDVDYALWAFSGQFTSKAEKAKVDAIIVDRGVKAMLDAEFPKPDANVTPSSYIVTEEPY